jgi:hypothetical protein
MKAIFLLLLFHCSQNTYSQKTANSFELKEGCYGRRNTLDSTSYRLWFIKNDSTFIYIGRSIDYKIGFIRMGKWYYLGDSMLSFQYKPLKSTLLLNSTIDYHAETKGSADSVYFNVTLKGPTCAYPGYCGLVFDNEKKEYARFGQAVGYGFRGVGVFDNGEVSFTIHKNSYSGSFGVTSSPAYYPLTINTFPNNNYHTLIINVPLKDSTNDVDISKFNEQPEVLRYRPSQPGKKMVFRDHDLLINFITKDRTPLLDILFEAKKRQPYLTGPIDELIEFLKIK